MIEIYRRILDRHLAAWEHARRMVKAEKAALAAAEAYVGHVEQAQRIVQGVAEAVQQAAHRQIAGVVTRCLQAVFGDEAYEFQIRFAQKRGKTEAELVFVRDGVEIDPMDGAGGGVVDVASFALRLACLVLAAPRKRRLLVLDEPFRFVSVEYRPALRQLVLSLAKEMGVQFIVVSHSSEFRMGRVVELE